MNTPEHFMQFAIDTARESMNAGKGGPFGAVVVKDGLVIARSGNEVLSSNDPTAHAEVMAIRKACEVLQSFQLAGCEIYTTCEPCPMCLGAIYWARPSKVFYALSREDAANAGFDDAFIYNELNISPTDRKIPFIGLNRESALSLFDEWKGCPFKKEY